MSKNTEYLNEIKTFCEKNGLRLTLKNNDRGEYSMSVLDTYGDFDYLVFTVQDFRSVFEDMKLEFERKK